MRESLDMARKKKMDHSTDPQDWWQRAMEDLETARWRSQNTYSPEAVTESAYAACEKMLKAVVIKNTGHLPNKMQTHSLNALADEVACYVPSVRDLCCRLSDMEPHFEPSRYECTQAYAISEPVRDDALSVMEKLHRLLEVHFRLED